MRLKHLFIESIVEKHSTSNSNAFSKPFKVVFDALVAVIAIDEHHINFARIYLNSLGVPYNQIDPEPKAIARICYLIVKPT